MSIGNLKTEGSKGTNFPWQYKMLKGLQGIIDVINSTANGTEYEAKLVNITCTGVPFAGTVLYLEVRVWDTDSGGWDGDPTYYLPGSTNAVPLATFTAAGCTIAYLEAGDATEATLAAILAKNTDIETNTDSLVDVANTPTIIRTSASLAVTLGPAVKSISFYNASATDDAHINTVDLKPGETVNFDAGGNGNYFSGSSFTYDADPDSGGAGDLLIIYVA